jgi:hypothetical protein
VHQATENQHNERPARAGIKQGINMNRFFRLSFLCSAAVFLGSVPSATAQEQRRIVLRDTQFKESFLQKVTVSGGIRAGFMFQSSMDHIDIHELYIHLQQDIEEPDAMLCVSMVSRDGRYTASWEYAIGQQSHGSIAVNLPSKYQEQIADYSTDALVVLAAITKKDCASGENKYVPASWGENHKSDYLLYVNSGSADTVIGIPGQKEKIQCGKIDSGSTVAYDTKCIIGKDMIGDSKSIFLVRNNFGNRLPNVEFKMR